MTPLKEVAERLGVGLTRARAIGASAYQERSRGPWGSWYEEMVEDILKQLAAPKHYRQFRLGPYRVDFLFPAARIVLEVNGIYHETEQGRKRDRGLRDLVGELGFILLDITTDELEADPNKTIASIVKLLAKAEKRDVS